MTKKRLHKRRLTARGFVIISCESVVCDSAINRLGAVLRKQVDECGTLKGMVRPGHPGTQRSELPGAGHKGRDYPGGRG